MGDKPVAIDNGDLNMTLGRHTEKVWYRMRITRRQLNHLKMLCEFHLQYSQNKEAKAGTARFRHCLERWPKLEQEAKPKGDE